MLGAANGRKLFLKIHVKIQIVISYVFACNKNKALQLQRVPVLSILGYSIGSLAASGLYQALQFPKPDERAANLTTAPSDQRSCNATGDWTRECDVIRLMPLFAMNMIRSALRERATQTARWLTVGRKDRECSAFWTLHCFQVKLVIFYLLRFVRFVCRLMMI